MQTLPQVGGQSDVSAGAAIDTGAILFQEARRDLLRPALVFGSISVAVIWLLGALTWILLGHVSTKPVAERSSRALGDSVPVTRQVLELTSGQEILVAAMLIVGVVLIAFLALGATLGSAKTIETLLSSVAVEGAVADSGRRDLPGVREVLSVGLRRANQQIPALLAGIAGCAIYLGALFGAFSIGIRSSAVVAFGLVAIIVIAGVFVVARLAWWPFVEVAENQLSRFAVSWRASSGRTLELVWVTLVIALATFMAEVLLNLAFTMVVGGSKGIDDAKTVVMAMIWVSLSMLVWFPLLSWQAAILIAAFRRKRLTLVPRLFKI